MSKNLSAKCYQKSKERLQKKLVKNIKIFLMKKKLIGNMFVNVMSVSQKLKKKSLVSIEKNIIEC